MKTALEMYSRASGADIPIAHYNLGWFYEHGIGVEKSLSLATHYYSLAGIQLVPEAVSALNRLGAAISPLLSLFARLEYDSTSLPAVEKDVVKTERKRTSS